MDADGLTSTKITNHPARDEAPDWSANGQKLVFQSFRSGPRGDVFIINADGVKDDGTENGTMRLTESPGRDLDPNWSPDGTQIVFDSDRNYIAQQIRQIFMMDPYGENETAITFPPHEDGHASWAHGPPEGPPSVP